MRIQFEGGTLSVVVQQVKDFLRATCVDQRAAVVEEVVQPSKTKRTRAKATKPPTETNGEAKVSAKQLEKIAVDVFTSQGTHVVEEILKSFGVEKLSELTADERVDVSAALKEVME